MFRPLEAIFSLHKIVLEERDMIYIVCATAYQWWDLSIITYWASIFKSNIYVQGWGHSLPYALCRQFAIWTWFQFYTGRSVQVLSNFKPCRLVKDNCLTRHTATQPKKIRIFIHPAAKTSVYNVHLLPIISTVNFSMPMPWRHIGREEVWLHLLLTSPLNGDERLTSLPGRFNPGKEHRYPYNRRLGWILVWAYPQQYIWIHPTS
jgi:hypothetical protein